MFSIKKFKNIDNKKTILPRLHQKSGRPGLPGPGPEPHPGHHSGRPRRPHVPDGPQPGAQRDPEAGRRPVPGGEEEPELAEPAQQPADPVPGGGHHLTQGPQGEST